MTQVAKGPDYIHEPIRKLAVPIDGLTPYERNARRGDLGAIMDSLETHGQYKPITVRAKTNEVLAGNHTLAAAKELGWSDIAVTFVDVDDDTAARIVLVDNRTSDMGTYDESELLSLLESLDPTGQDLTGTGYQEEDFKALQALLDTDGEDLEPFTDDEFDDVVGDSGEATLKIAGLGNMELARFRDVPGDDDLERFRHLMTVYDQSIQDRRDAGEEV